MNLWSDFYDVVYVESDDPRIAGWYVVETTAPDPSKWLWQNRGNGPECMTDSVIAGPLSSKEFAEESAKRYFEELTRGH